LQNDAEQNITVTVVVEATPSKVPPSLEIQARVQISMGWVIEKCKKKKKQKRKSTNKRRKEPED
jgi:hypothetical protein